MGSYLANQWFLLIERAPWFRYRTMMGWWRQQRRINCVSRQNDFGVILDWPIWTAFRPNIVSYKWIYFIYGPENTHLLCKGKYQCTADLLFDWFGFSCFLNWNYKQICLFGQILMGQTGGQPNSDIFPCEVSECSLAYYNSVTGLNSSQYS